MKKRTSELVLSLILVAVGIFAIVVIQAQSTTAVNNTGATTFRTFPTVYGALIIVFAGINAGRLVLEGLREDKALRAAGKKEEAAPLTEEERADRRRIALRVAGMFLLTLGFALLLKKIHFALLVFVFLFLSFLLLGRRKIWLNAVVSAVGSGLVYLIFEILLKLPL